MAHVNIEIKATCRNPAFIRQYLQANNAQFRGIDHQIDTYFNVQHGRLKLREGNIEHNLIFYERSDQPGVKESNFDLVTASEPTALKVVLTKSLGIKVIVEKRREIYFIENVKFHIDEVAGLGSFVEIEAGNLFAAMSKEQLHRQCEVYLQELRISKADLISVSYSDMLMAGKK